jgi:excisionase family DNA binding protein
MTSLAYPTLDIPTGFRGLLLSADEWAAASQASDSGTQISILDGLGTSERQIELPTLPTGLVGIRDAARRLGVHENTIRNWVEHGRLQFVRLPGSGYRRVDARDVERLRDSMYVSFAAHLREPLADPENTRDRGVYKGGGQQTKRGDGSAAL